MARRFRQGNQVQSLPPLPGFLNANPIPHLKARVANYGLMDQIAALHWVQQNIALFGGDAGNVTMLGHGSGAACINFLMISPTVMQGTDLEENLAEKYAQYVMA